VQTQQSLLKLVQAGEILDFLKAESPSAKAVCKWLAKMGSEGLGVEAVYYRAEIMRLYRCDDGALTTSVRGDV